ncbi:LOW QUALITY PROTEIN: pyrokinin-1 receptor-like [Liolophura sinensis]|uniref:LOW QUALITY PROTEIN: pyrokinin-1 receptor-like n=1 Tax=Liolophura sinensis TaxID=3198878 RepID=UPI00315809F0
MDLNRTCGNFSCNGTENNSQFVDIEKLLSDSLGERRRDLPSAVVLTVVYSLVFITGTIGNVCTCVVIAKNSYMHTTTNYYLFSLAVSDLLMILSCLPPELYQIWEAYPWIFGEPFCIVKILLTEMTSYASVLTITTFTIERYIAICHPLLAHKMADTRRAIKIIICVWVNRILFALPYPIHTRTSYYVSHPVTGEPVKDSLTCTIPLKWRQDMTVMFQISSFLFFVTPMAIITVLYILIGITIGRSGLSRGASEESCQGRPRGTAQSTPRRAVLKMLVAVVVAFFVCWAPFHAQRFMTLYVKDWTKTLLEVQSQLFYVSGLLLYVSSTVNPILYNLMSKRYRQAFRETLCCCIGQKNPRRFSFGNSHTEQTVNNGLRTVRFLSADKSQTKPVYGSNRLQVPGKSDSCLQERLLSGVSKASPDDQNGCVLGCKKTSDPNGRLLGRNELSINKNGHSSGEVCLSPITSDNSRQQLLAEECHHDNTPL